MKSIFKKTLAVATVALATQAMAQVTFYERENFQGRSFTTQQQVDNLQRYGFNDRASSVQVAGQPWQRWEVCDNARFGGRCAVLRPGGYPSLVAMGLDNQVSSVRAVGRDARVDDARYAPPPPAPVYDAHRRPNEKLFEANVTSVRAVVGPPEQRCWVEREQVQDRKTNVPATIAGAVIGGILGHQIGNGRGNDLATVGGAVAGGAAGASLGRNGQTATRDVQRCNTVPSQADPELYDVTYNFRGQEHRVQLTSPPGPTLTVNRQGEPRA